MNRIPVLIIGGGISGLATAWFLHRKNIALRLFESRNQVGGVLRSDRINGYLVERGPHSTLQKIVDDEDVLGDLIRDLDLDPALQVADPVADNRFVVRNGTLHPLPLSPRSFLITPLFSLSGKLRLLMEPLISRASGEESVAHFVRRRLGEEFLNYAVDPFVSGVYAGDPKKLSLQAALPAIAAVEQQYGSLIRGAVARRKGGAPSGRMISFKEGMEQLPRRILEKLPPHTVETGKKVTDLHPDSTDWRVTWHDEQTGESGQCRAQKIVLAIPAPAAADLLDPLSRRAAKQLRKISYAPLASIALGFKKRQIGHSLNGFGCLIPQRERIRSSDPNLLGALFPSAIFPERVPSITNALITAFAGGATATSFQELSETTIVRHLQNRLSSLLTIQGEPDLTAVTRYRGAIPQYLLGHLEIIREIDEALASFHGLYTRANWRDGISVMDCVRQAKRFSESYDP